MLHTKVRHVLSRIMQMMSCSRRGDVLAKRLCFTQYYLLSSVVVLLCLDRSLPNHSEYVVQVDFTRQSNQNKTTKKEGIYSLLWKT